MTWNCDSCGESAKTLLYPDWPCPGCGETVWWRQAGAWIEQIPEVPLTRGVAVIHTAGGTAAHCARGVVVDVESVDVDPELGSPVAWVAGGGFEGVSQANWPDLRVDLDDPQGFGYALRLYHQIRPSGHAIRDRPRGGRVLYDRWLRGATDDADRLLLARALAEVVP
jgi:hypothetical protein